jgi:hypothetical protein
MAIALMAAGVLAVAGGAVGLATNKGETPVAVGSASPSASPSTSASPSASPSPVAETVEEFLPVFQDAINSGDAAFLLDRLHPAVLDLYGEAQCRTGLTAFRDPTLRFKILSVAGPEPYVYDPDGREIPVEDAFKVRVRRTSQGTTKRTDVHFALIGGQLRWFTDCGTPK